jgi:hypothetical protein
MTLSYRASLLHKLIGGRNDAYGHQQEAQNATLAKHECEYYSGQHDDTLCRVNIVYVAT